mgnify:FL=1|jgi:hypothetical protein
MQPYDAAVGLPGQCLVLGHSSVSGGLRRGLPIEPEQRSAFPPQDSSLRGVGLKEQDVLTGDPISVAVPRYGKVNQMGPRQLPPS